MVTAGTAATRMTQEGIDGFAAAGAPHAVVVGLDPNLTYARLVGRENVIAGTDCGFSQGAFTPRVHASIMWAKLQALAEGAALATKQLWSRTSR